MNFFSDFGAKVIKLCFCKLLAVLVLTGGMILNVKILFFLSKVFKSCLIVSRLK
jgi:hypothetical protein